MTTLHLTGLVLWNLLRYISGETELRPWLDDQSGSEQATNQWLQAYNAQSGGHYDSRQVAVAKAGTDYMMQHWPNPKKWASKHHYDQVGLPDTWEEYFAQLGAPGYGS